MPTDLDLGPTDVVVFKSGTCAGSINTNCATICVAELAVFTPEQHQRGARLFVRGNVVLPTLAADSGAVLDNEGTVLSSSHNRT